MITRGWYSGDYEGESPLMITREGIQMITSGVYSNDGEGEGTLMITRVRVL